MCGLLWTVWPNLKLKKNKCLLDLGGNLKKGVSIPIEFIIVLALAVITLAAILLFFTSAQKSGGAGISSAQAIAHCKNVCAKDQELITSLVDDDEDGECDCIPVGISFCTEPVTVGGKSMTCKELTICRLTDPSGISCRLNCSASTCS